MDRRSFLKVAILSCWLVPGGSLASVLSVATLRTDSARHQIAVEVADTPESRARGLMFRETMPLNQGMLFDFKTDRIVTMWMRNTPLPLDMIFIDRTGEIVRIAKNTVPFSEETIPSGKPVRFVLEVNAGVSEKIGLRAGHLVEHAIIDAVH